MKALSIFKILILAATICCLSSCKKNSVDPAFTASMQSNVYSFDSLFAWVDTSSASLGRYYINVGAKNTKEGNLVYLEGTAYVDKNLAGNYYFVDPQPYPLPTTYKWLQGFSVVLNTGSNKGIFALAGSNVSKLSIDKISGSTVQGNFSIQMNPTFSDGSTNKSQSLQMIGQFNLPYHFIP